MGEIYKITNKINGKIYIGQTYRSSETRLKEHIRDAKNVNKDNKNVPLHKAIVKYGENNFELEILETNVDRSKLDDLEKYYIDKSKSNISSIGYNATDGGNGGKTKSKLNKKDVEKIIDLIKNTNLSFSEIARTFNISNSVVSSINRGESWKNNEIRYPIRNFSATEIGIDREKYASIINDILNSELKLLDIAEKYDVSISLISGINNGKYCYDGKNSYYSDIYCGNFPIRKNKTEKIDYDFNSAFYDVLFTDKSICQIEREYKINFNGLRYIVLGKRRREITQQYKVPMRKNIEYNRKVWLDINKEKIK